MLSLRGWGMSGLLGQNVCSGGPREAPGVRRVVGQHGGLQRDPGRVSRGKGGARKRKRTTCSKVVCCKAKW